MTARQRALGASSKSLSASNESIAREKSANSNLATRRKRSGIVAMLMLFLLSIGMTIGVMYLQKTMFPNTKKRQIQIWLPLVLEKTKMATAMTVYNFAKNLAKLDDDKITLVPHFINDFQINNKTIQVDNHPTMDVCHLLKECFPTGDVYDSDKVCHPNVGMTLRYYDSAFLVKDHGTLKQRIVGFISIYRDYNPWVNQQALMIYNVCVAPDQRGKGLAKRLITEFTENLIDHYKLRHLTDPNLMFNPSTNYKVPKPLLLGLDVDLTSDMMTKSLALYAKLGFIRHWAPCKSISQADWSQVYNQLLKEPDSLAPSAIQKLLNDPASYVNSSFPKGDHKKFTHYCMYKFYSDSWDALGSFLQNYSAGIMPPTKKLPIDEKKKQEKPKTSSPPTLPIENATTTKERADNHNHQDI